jgi:thiamine-monophosphate kinase
MRFSEVGEFGFIDRIARGAIHRPQGVVQGIGDDAAVFETRPGWPMVLTTDLLVEGVHFLRHAISPRQLGRKALAVNLSDVAAMGAEPLDAFVSVAIPAELEVEYMEAVYGGLGEMARDHGVNLLGGDTTRSPGPLVINVAVTGTAPAGQLVLRSGARPGDGIYVTGFLGDAAGGLDLIRSGRAWEPAATAYLLGAHLDPRPQVAEGRFIAQQRMATAMIDVSDGVASDLGHICVRSGVGAVIRAEALPISRTLRQYCARFGLDLLRLALGTGEDYGLLLTVPAGRAADLEARFLERFGRPIRRIGEITPGPQMLLVASDGEPRPLAPEGWDGFRGQG